MQEVQDNGPNDWVVMVCKPCHRILTAEARQVRKAAGVGSTRKAPPGAATRVRPAWGTTVRLAGFAAVVGAVFWAAGYHREVVAAGILYVVGNVPVAVWRVRRARRQTVIRGLTDMLAKATNTLHGNMRVRVRRWDGRRPVKGSATYSWIFADAPTSPARAEIEESLIRTVGTRLTVTWHTADKVVAWEPDTDPAPRTPPRSSQARTAAAARVRDGIVAVLGPLIDFTVDKWDGDTPIMFTFRHPPQSPVHSERVQDAVEDKVAKMLPGTWRADWDTHHDTVTFTDTPDPLAHVVTPVEPGEQVDLAALPLGEREDGQPWTLRLVGSTGATHVLIGGATGSGKGSVIWALINALTPAILSGHVRLWGGDPKGGMELGKGRDVWHEYATSPPDIANMLARAVETMQARSERLAAAGVRCHTPTADEPLIVVVVDEIASLTKYHPDRKVRDQIAGLLATLLTQGRAPGVCVIGALQDPRKEVLSMRDLFPTRIALRCTDALQPNLVLGDGARAAGGRADKINPDTPGVGYVMVDGAPAPVRVRTAWVRDDQITALARRIRRSRNTARRPAQAWEPMYPRDLADLPWREQTVWVRFDADGRTIEATVVGLVENPVDGDETDLDWQAADGEVGSITLGRDEIVHVRQ